MSRIVKSAKLIGTKNNVQLWLMRIECDTMQDLPAANAYGSDTLICIGSTAHIIADNAMLEIDSAGQWVQQVAGTSSYTRAEIDTFISAINAEIASLVDRGAKNLFPNNATSQTVGGVTFIVNSDGSISANGTKTNNDWLMLSTGNTLKAGTYVLSDDIPIDTTDCQLIITTGTSLGTAIMATAANARPKITVLTNDYTGLYYAIRIASGKTVNNLTFRPMICTESDWTVSQNYVPHAPTNRELYQMILALSSP